MPIVQKQGETFTPGYDWRVELGIDELTPKIITNETSRRLKWLTDNSIVKVTTGKQVDQLFWNHIKKIPVTLVERKNKLEQILSWGFAKHTDEWAIWKPSTNNINSFVYKENWFNAIAEEIILYRNLKNEWFEHVEDILYYEDINQYKNNGRLPLKQRPQTIDEKLLFVENRNQLLEWHNLLLEKINE